MLEKKDKKVSEKGTRNVSKSHKMKLGSIWGSVIYGFRERSLRKKMCAVTGSFSQHHCFNGIVRKKLRMTGPNGDGI